MQDTSETRRLRDTSPLSPFDTKSPISPYNIPVRPQPAVGSLTKVHHLPLKEQDLTERNLMDVSEDIPSRPPKGKKNKKDVAPIEGLASEAVKVIFTGSQNDEQEEVKRSDGQEEQSNDDDHEEEDNQQDSERSIVMKAIRNAIDHQRQQSGTFLNSASASLEAIDNSICTEHGFSDDEDERLIKKKAREEKKKAKEKIKEEANQIKPDQEIFGSSKFTANEKQSPRGNEPKPKAPKTPKGKGTPKPKKDRKSIKKFTEVKKQRETEKIRAKIRGNHQEVKKAIYWRRGIRFLALFLYVASIAITLGISFATVIQKESLLASDRASFDITLENCTLLITDHTDSNILNPIYMKYQVPRELKTDPGSEFSSTSEENTQKLFIKNIFDPRYCLVELYVKPDAELNSLKINCPRCNITQDNSFQLQVTEALDINGSVVNANFRNIKVGSISYKTVSGYLQLSNIDTSSTANEIKIENEGDIIIQSTSDFKVNVTSPGQTFCFNAPHVTPSTDNCAISGDESTATSRTNTSCLIVANLCSSATCAISAEYTIVSNISNVYANIIPQVGTPILSSNPTTKGLVYDDGLGFSSSVEGIVTSFDRMVGDETKGNPFVILDLGNIDSRSSRYNKWVISSTPSYSYMRPWWIATVSATVLNGYVEHVKGFLLPGVCPFVPEYTTSHLLSIQKLISSKIHTESTLITFVNDETMPLPPSTPQVNTGVFYFAPRGNPYDHWFTLVELQGGDVMLENKNWKDKVHILAAVITSLVIAALISYSVLEITVVAINVMYHKLVGFANHMDSYSKLEQTKAQKALEDPKDKRNKKQVINTRSSLATILINAPSPSAFVDYLGLVFYRQLTNSVEQFYRILFTEAKQDELNDKEFDPTHDMITGIEVKVLYEKFCFVNHLSEQKLTSKSNVRLLKQFGFNIVTREDLPCEVFTRINIKNYDNFLINPLKDYKDMDSLQIYMAENVKITEFEEDQVDINTFRKVYSDFCDYNRLERVLISASVMREKFDIHTSFVPQQFIMRNEAEVDLEEEERKRNRHFLLKQGDMIKDNLFMIKDNFLTLGRIRGSHKKIHVLDPSKLENHFNLVMNKLTEMNEAQIASATKDLIFYPKWAGWDFLTVLVHFLCGVLVSVPLVIIVILNESQYEPWSLKEPLHLIRFMDILRDPKTIVYNLYHGFAWNIVIMIIISILWILSILDLVLYYSVMEFPQDKSFRRSEDRGETLLQKISRGVEWGLVLFSLGCYFGYVGLLITWFLLGALINPNAFLPFASAAVTFVTFVTTKYNSFKTVASQGTQAVLEHLKEIFGDFIKQLSGKLYQNLLHKTSDALTEKGKEILDSSTFKQATEKLSETGIIDARTIDEYTQKLKNIESKTVAAGIVAVAADPTIVLNEINNLASDLKGKAIEKVKDNCHKQNIPESLVDFVVATSQKDTPKMKENLTKLLNECHQYFYLPPEGVEITVDLIFCEDRNKEETIKKIIKLIFKNLNLNIPNLTPEILISSFSNLKNLQEMKLEPFIKGLKELLTQVQESQDITEIKVFLPILDIISIISKNQGGYSKLKNPALNLLVSTVTYLTKGNPTTIKSFAQFLSIVSSSYETPYDIQTNEPLTSNDIFSVINDFCTSFELNQICEQAGLSPNFATDIIYFVIAYARQETDDLPKELIRDLEKLFTNPYTKAINKSEFFPFCFSLVSAIFNTPEQFHERLQQNISSFDVEEDLQNFLKILTCYRLDDFKTRYPNLSIENNKYFQKLAHALKIQPDELLGLIDIVYKKESNQNQDAFLIAILKRMSLKLENLEYIKPLVSMFLSEDEPMLLDAIKDLNLEFEQFLLVGKGILNPTFISESELKKLELIEPNLLKSKDIKFNPARGNCDSWKKKLRATLQEAHQNVERKYRETIISIHPASQTEELSGEEIAKRQEEANKLERYLVQLDLIKLYLNDWESFSFSKKNITALVNVLNNEKNQLKNHLFKPDRNSVYSGIDFLATVLSLEELGLQQGKRHSRMDKDKQSTITILSEWLSIDSQVLKTCLEIFTLGDPKAVLKSFLTFFKREEEMKDEIKKILLYGFKQVSVIENQLDFIINKLPNSIEFMGEKLPLPKGLFKKIFFGKSEGQLSISEALEFANLAIRKLKSVEHLGFANLAMGNLKSVGQLDLLDMCYKVGCFAKGMLSKDQIKSMFNIQNETILKLFDILTQHNEKAKLSDLTELFEENHPIKKAIAFYGLVTRQNFKIRHSINKPNKPAEFREEPIKQYLASQLNIYPEVFDLFELCFERNITTFIQKALPVVRRISQTAFVDPNLIESLFALSLGEHFNTGYLALKLEISGDVIDFFVTLIRLSNRSTRQDELKRLANSTPVQKIFTTKLGVIPKEVIALFKLVFDIFEDDALEEIFQDLGLTIGSNNKIIDTELFKRFVLFNKYIKSSNNMLEYRKQLAQERIETVTFWNSLELNSSSDCAFIISRLIRGDFLVFREFKQQLSWAFPDDNSEATNAFRNLTMGLCGIIHPNTNISGNQNKTINLFIEAFKENHRKFEEAEKKDKNQPIPNNSMAYAIYLAYQTIDINPFWMQAFLLSQEPFKDIISKLPDLRIEFVLTLVLNFTTTEFLRDFVGLYEWNVYCANFCGEKPDNLVNGTSSASPFADYEFHQFLSRARMFDYGQTYKIAKEMGLLKESFWQKCFESAEKYNFNINRSFLYLLTLEDDIDTRKMMFERLSQFHTDTPMNFLKQLSKILPEIRTNNGTVLETKKEGFTVNNIKSVGGFDMPLMGVMIHNAIIECYNVVSNKYNPKAQRDPNRGYELTNLSIMGAIAFLRNSTQQEMPYERLLYNLHQLTMNIERKLYLEPCFYKMSKFRVMKFVGITLGMQISNIVEWCLPPSLFTNDYAEELSKFEATKSEESKEGPLIEVKRAKAELSFKTFQADHCRKIVFMYKDPEIIVGDLGINRGNYKTYHENNYNMERLFSWDFIQRDFDLSNYYFSNPEGDVPEPDPENQRDRLILNECKCSDNIYKSREMVSLQYDGEEWKNILQKPEVKTGIKYQELERKYLEFEKILTHPNMSFLEGITKGDTSILSKDHIMNRNDETKAKTKVYIALLGLQSFRRSQQKNRKQFHEYMNILSVHMDSNLAKMEELMMFFISKQPTLNECLSALELPDQIADLLLMRAKDTVKGEDFSKSFVIKAIQETLVLDEFDLEVFEIIRRIYESPEKSNWISLINKLFKDSNAAALKDHPLLKLIEVINFSKLKEKASSLDVRDISQFFKNNSKSPKSVFAMILDTVVQKKPPSPKKSSKLELEPSQDEDFMPKLCKAIQLIIDQEFSQLFEMLLLNSGQQNNSEAPSQSTFLEEMLKHFGVNTEDAAIQSSIKLLRVFLTISNTDLTTLKSNNENYNRVINQIIEDLSDCQLISMIGSELDGLTGGKVIKLPSLVATLLVGVFTWDLELVINALINEDTINEAFLLYHIYGSLKLNERLSSKPSSEIQGHLRVLLAAVLKGVTSESTAENILDDQEGGLKRLIEDFKGFSVDILSDSNEENPRSLLQRMREKMRKTFTLKKSKIKRLETGGNAFESLLEIVTSICDGTIVVTLLDKVVKDPLLKEFLIDIVKFVLMTMEKFSTPVDEVIDNNKKIIDALTETTRTLEKIVSQYGENDILEAIIKYIPRVMKICLASKTEAGREEEIKIVMLDILKDIIHSVAPEKEEFFFGILTVLLGIDVKAFDLKKIETHLKIDLGIDRGIDVFLKSIFPKIFPGLRPYFYSKLYQIILKLKTDFMLNYKDPSKQRQILMDIAELTEEFDVVNPEIIRSVIYLMEGDIEKAKPLIRLVVPKNISDDTLDTTITYIGEAKAALNIDFASKLALASSKDSKEQTRNKVDQDAYENMMKRVKEGVAQPKDLFRLVDEEGDRTGSISEVEFENLANRLGVKLSKHRIKEIFAKIKQSKARGASEIELNEKEFEQALEYLESKNLTQALQLLGITPEVLTYILLRSIIFLLLLFVFIFFGIKAFAIGGTFGSIVNSLFPAAGGLSLAKQDNTNKDKVTDDSVKEASKTGIEITMSEQL